VALSAALRTITPGTRIWRGTHWQTKTKYKDTKKIFNAKRNVLIEKEI